MYPILFEWGPVRIYSYGFTIAIGVIVSMIILKKEFIKPPFSTERLIDYMFITLFSGIVGARLWYIVVYWSEFQYDWLSMLKVWQGGLIFYGGLIFATGVVLLIGKIKKIPFFSITDALVPLLAITQGFGRIGCFLNGCCWGRETSLCWGVHFPLLEGPRHPTQLYESLFCFILFFVLVRLYKQKKYDGHVTLWYFFLYGCGRFLIQFFRADQPKIYFLLDRPQFISIGVVLAASLIFLIKRKSHETN